MPLMEKDQFFLWLGGSHSDGSRDRVAKLETHRNEFFKSLKKTAEILSRCSSLSPQVGLVFWLKAVSQSGS